jgi:hypothetical protein
MELFVYTVLFSLFGVPFFLSGLPWYALPVVFVLGYVFFQTTWGGWSRSR